MALALALQKMFATEASLALGPLASLVDWPKRSSEHSGTAWTQTSSALLRAPLSIAARASEVAQGEGEVVTVQAPIVVLMSVECSRQGFVGEPLPLEISPPNVATMASLASKPCHLNAKMMVWELIVAQLVMGHHWSRQYP